MFPHPGPCRVGRLRWPRKTNPSSLAGRTHVVLPFPTWETVRTDCLPTSYQLRGPLPRPFPVLTSLLGTSTLTTSFPAAPGQAPPHPSPLLLEHRVPRLGPCLGASVIWLPHGPSPGPGQQCPPGSPAVRNRSICFNLNILLCRLFFNFLSWILLI